MGLAASDLHAARGGSSVADEPKAASPTSCFKALQDVNIGGPMKNPARFCCTQPAACREDSSTPARAAKNTDREHAIARLDREVRPKAGDLPEDGREVTSDFPDEFLHGVARGELVLVEDEMGLPHSGRSGRWAGLPGGVRRPSDT